MTVLTCLSTVRKHFSVSRTVGIRSAREAGGTMGKEDGKGSNAEVSPEIHKAEKSEATGIAMGEKFTLFYKKTSHFSQHYPCTFKIAGITYNCAEQYMMHQKAVLFKDKEMAKRILGTNNPVEQKRFGRKVKNFDKVVWNRKSEDIVRIANIEKNPNLKQILFNTRGTTLAEASPRDRIWGIGLGATNPKAQCRKTWRGKNLLGKILTHVRETLIEKEKKLKESASKDELSACKATAIDENPGPSKE